MRFMHIHLEFGPFTNVRGTYQCNSRICNGSKLRDCQLWEWPQRMKWERSITLAWPQNELKLSPNLVVQWTMKLTKSRWFVYLDLMWNVGANKPSLVHFSAIGSDLVRLSRSKPDHTRTKLSYKPTIGHWMTTKSLAIGETNTYVDYHLVTVTYAM